MAVMKTLDARSPVEINHPCIQHSGEPTSMASLASHATFSRNAMACWMSASSRLRISTRNWLGGSLRRRSNIDSSIGGGSKSFCGHRWSSGTRKPLSARDMVGDGGPFSSDALRRGARTHPTSLYARKKNRPIDEKKLMKPNVTTAGRPCRRTAGRGVSE
jgi:hypothetical protein